MKNSMFLFSLMFLVFACSSNESPKETKSKSAPAKVQPKKDDGMGVGEIKKVTLNNPLDENMIKSGKGIYEMKCSACHRSTSQRVVGPGFKGVTSRRKPEWIMNMITNVEVMLEEDATAQALLKECLTRMPNQNLSVGDAREVLEWMLDNDKKE